MQQSGLFWLAIFCIVIPTIYFGIQRIDEWRRGHLPVRLSEQSAYSFFKGWNAWAVWASYPSLLIGTAMLAGAGGWFLAVVTKAATWKYDIADLILAGVVGLVGFILSSFGRHYFNLGRRTRALTAEQLLTRDQRPLVLYLRSFLDDTPMSQFVPTGAKGTMDFSYQSCEEQMAEVFGEFGPVVAIGKPGEALPELGAARVYVPDDKWKVVVEDYMKRAGLVVFLPGDTAGIWWEIQRSAELLSCDKLLFLIHNAFDFNRFRQDAEKIFKVPFPTLPPGSPKEPLPGNLKGVLYFDRNKQPHYLSICSKGWRLELKPAVSASLKLTLRPLFEQRGVAWAPPPYSIIIVLFGIGLVLLAVALVIVVFYFLFWR